MVLSKWCMIAKHVFHPDCTWSHRKHQPLGRLCGGFAWSGLSEVEDPPSLWEVLPGQGLINLLAACLSSLSLVCPSLLLLLHSFSSIRTNFFYDSIVYWRPAGALQVVSARLELHRHSAPWTEQIPDSGAFCCKTMIVGLQGPHPCKSPTYTQLSAIPFSENWLIVSAVLILAQSAKALRIAEIFRTVLILMQLYFQKISSRLQKQSSQDVEPNLPGSSAAKPPGITLVSTF